MVARCIDLLWVCVWEGGASTWEPGKHCIESRWWMSLSSPGSGFNISAWAGNLWICDDKKRDVTLQFCSDHRECEHALWGFCRHAQNKSKDDFLGYYLFSQLDRACSRWTAAHQSHVLLFALSRLSKGGNVIWIELLVPRPPGILIGALTYAWILPCAHIGMCIDGVTQAETESIVLQPFMSEFCCQSVILIISCDYNSNIPPHN